ncbi:hypothetical protein ACQEVZ_45595 [Dactylosporangium sp. CA-152071]
MRIRDTRHRTAAALGAMLPTATALAAVTTAPARAACPSIRQTTIPP